MTELVLPNTEALELEFANEWLTIWFNQPERRNPLTDTVVEELAPTSEERAAYLGRAFAAASEALSRRADRQVLDWLLAVRR